MGGTEGAPRPGLTGHHLSFRMCLISSTFFLCSLRLFQKFDTFRILVCGGDGSVGWVLSEIDSLNLHKQVPDVEGPSPGRAVSQSETGHAILGDAPCLLGAPLPEGAARVSEGRAGG